VSVRELVKGIQTEMLRGNVTPSRAADCSVQLASLLGNCSVEIVEANHDYSVVRRTLFRSLGTASAAKIEGEATEEFKRKLAAEAVKGDVQELINALKALTRVATEEMRFTPR
jgi:hypothetical protein